MNEKSIQGTYWRHVKSGGIYFVSIDNGAVLEPTQAPCVTYESLTDPNFPPQVREKELFLDGRFAEIPLAEVKRIWAACGGARREGEG